MNQDKAVKRVRRKLSRALNCPFCGNRPEFRCNVELTLSPHGTIGHYASREGCCKPTGLGQTELFFSHDGKQHYRQWKCMVDRLVDEWNKRYPI
jgi:hypothetical protein